ncbi:MAG: hypothetical protein EZS28_016365 [Streblomastix strix]|uniref:Uncharacterized protein n=1 Tax=Streblomastix strix TaxID=222440 RepID=A0A5J4VZM0_9EUKA|nr:MAG: hypothetical protein EZS28_016365 [Streblomastix strix]
MTPEDHLFPFKSGLATLSYQMHNSTEEMPSIYRLALPNLINRGYNDSDKKKKHEEQTKRLDSNYKRELNCNNQKSCMINWRNQLPSVPVSTNISLDECNQQAQDQSYSERGLKCICYTLEANSGQPLDNSDINYVEQITLIEGQNSRFKINNICERRWLRYDSGAQLRINNGRRSMARLMTSTFKQLERVSR